MNQTFYKLGFAVAAVQRNRGLTKFAISMWNGAKLVGKGVGLLAAPSMGRHIVLPLAEGIHNRLADVGGYIRGGMPGIAQQRAASGPGRAAGYAAMKQHMSSYDPEHLLSSAGRDMHAGGAPALWSGMKQHTRDAFHPLQAADRMGLEAANRAVPIMSKATAKADAKLMAPSVPAANPNGVIGAGMWGPKPVLPTSSAPNLNI
jgi:hypothetical protein